MAKLERCMEQLWEWNKREFGNVKLKLKKVRDELRTIQKQGMVGSFVGRRRQLEREENELMATEELIWFQRGKENEMKWGDRNSQFFHGRANGRRKSNKIRRLIDDDGMEWHRRENKMKVAVEYFQGLFKTDLNAHSNTAPQGLSPLLTDEDNSQLLRPFTGDEVHAALFSMHPTKSPGPDGMSALFFQKHWHIVEHEVSSFVLNILHGAELPDRLNHTFISLIPKVNNPYRMKDLRPISLCNVLYKIVSKVLASRLKLVLDKIIARTHSAFILGRLIIDNVLAAFEIFHYMKNRRTGKIG